MAQDRKMVVPETDPPIAEGWEVDGPDMVVGDDEPDELLQLLFDAATVLRRVGGVFSVAAVRRETAPDMFETVEYQARWNSYAPPARERQENGSAVPVEVAS